MNISLPPRPQEEARLPAVARGNGPLDKSPNAHYRCKGPELRS